MKEILEITYLEIEENDKYEQLATKVVEQCFKTENLLDKNLYINITLTEEKNIQNINKEYRKIDKPTDVLSFPMFTKEEIEEMYKKTEKIEIQDILGDIIISIPQVEKQAKEYGHGFERELAYMIVHGFYHLMGYDHLEEKEKLQMRQKEENILNELKILR